MPIKCVLRRGVILWYQRLEKHLQKIQPYLWSALKMPTETYWDHILQVNMPVLLENWVFFSFNGNKIITTGGGGLIITESEKLAKKAKHKSHSG